MLRTWRSNPNERMFLQESVKKCLHYSCKMKPQNIQNGKAVNKYNYFHILHSKDNLTVRSKYRIRKSHPHIKFPEFRNYWLKDSKFKASMDYGASPYPRSQSRKAKQEQQRKHSSVESQQISK